MSRQPSTQTNRFDMTASAEIPRSSFDLSHGVKTTFDASDLIPILNLEVLPGDSISCRASIFARMATPLKPLLDNLHCETFFFFTPTRQVWENWVKMHGEQINPDDSTDYVVPVVTSPGSGWAEGTLGDYFGIPINVIIDVNAIPFRIHNHIYRNWFRDENLVDSPEVPLDDGPDDPTLYQIYKRRKRKDYFTGCLPWPQKGPDTMLPLGDIAPVRGLGSTVNGTQTDVAVEEYGGVLKTYANAWNNTFTSQAIVMEATPGDISSPNVYADLSQATGVSINDLRESIQIQRLLERDARGGTRYPELLRSHFGVTDPMMLVHQRPVFLGGGHTMVNINPIAQTSGTAGTGEYTPTPQGNLAAIGTISASGHGFTYSATEHGFITGYINVRADLTYQQGLERYWSRSTRFDYFYPALGHLGEMAVLNKEIYAQGTAEDDLVFGYQEAWADYRYVPSKITGAFRSTSSASLDVWHLAQDFANLPTLSQTFIEENVPMDRVTAVPSEPDFLCDIYFRIKAARPLPLYSTPGLMDHF